MINQQMNNEHKQWNYVKRIITNGTQKTVFIKIYLFFSQTFPSKRGCGVEIGKQTETKKEEENNYPRKYLYNNININ